MLVLKYNLQHLQIFGANFMQARNAEENLHNKTAIQQYSKTSEIKDRYEGMGFRSSSDFKLDLTWFISNCSAHSVNIQEMPVSLTFPVAVI